ncbi:cytochrome b [Polaromonas sp.]|uniref:cytochrome b n=1 Tax=Polaromonas sp. TaxID=1869339 RepID=UPI0013B6A45A|nr:cytochrome b [Polaromonas sp.]NDP61814.1 cytochrome b [Polaromonas sp.]
MTVQKLTNRYHMASISLHWLMLALFIAVYASIELRVLFEKGTELRETMKNLHFMFGLLIFFLVWLRLAMRIIYPAPRIEPAPPPWQALSAKLAHVMLYVLMIGMPLAGWLMLSAAGKPIPFFGLELPALIGKNKELAGQIKEVHELVGTIGYYLIGMHAAAALFHHYIKRDSTLRAMLPKASV